MAGDTEVTGGCSRSHARQRHGGRLVLAGTVALLAILLASVAPAAAVASSGTQTLVGEGENGYSPSSVTATMHVNASETGGVTSGTLTTAGKVTTGIFAQFKGSVTCIKKTGSVVLVGAVGTVSVVPNEGPPKPQPGTYAQTLSVELGSFTDPSVQESPIYTFRYGMLGEHGEGIETTSPPTCSTGPKAWALPTLAGKMSYTSTPGEPEPEPTPEPCGHHHQHDDRCGCEEHGHDGSSRAHQVRGDRECDEGHEHSGTRRR